MAHFYRLIFLLALVLLVPEMVRGADDDCGCSEMRVAVKSNLLHDALLTPDAGIEVRLPGNFSVAVEGILAWWTDDSRHHCWRIYGGWKLAIGLAQKPTKEPLPVIIWAFMVLSIHLILSLAKAMVGKHPTVCGVWG